MTHNKVKLRQRKHLLTCRPTSALFLSSSTKPCLPRFLYFTNTLLSNIHPYMSSALHVPLVPFRKSFPPDNDRLLFRTSPPAQCPVQTSNQHNSRRRSVSAYLKNSLHTVWYINPIPPLLYYHNPTFSLADLPLPQPQYTHTHCSYP